MDKTNNAKLRDYSNRKPYNNVACPEGQVLTPVVLSDSMKEILKCTGLDLKNVETWKLPGSGLKYPVVFIPMTPEAASNYHSTFNGDITEYIGEKYHTNCSKDLSLDAMIDALEDDDRKGYDPSGTNYFEETFELEEMLKDLVNNLNEQDEHMGQIITLIAQGYNLKETGERVDLGLGPTQTFTFIKKTQKLAKKIYDEKYK